MSAITAHMKLVSSTITAINTVRGRDETFIRYAVVRKDRCVRSSGFLLTSATAVPVKHRKHRFFKALFA